VIANASHDTLGQIVGPDQYEEADELVAGFFDEPDDTEWTVYEDSYFLKIGTSLNLGRSTEGSSA
jgi:hypothetical protein